MKQNDISIECFGVVVDSIPIVKEDVSAMVKELLSESPANMQQSLLLSLYANALNCYYLNCHDNVSVDMGLIAFLQEMIKDRDISDAAIAGCEGAAATMAMR